jgi:hypothetical protein
MSFDHVATPTQRRRFNFQATRRTRFMGKARLRECRLLDHDGRYKQERPGSGASVLLPRMPRVGIVILQLGMRRSTRREPIRVSCH